MNTIDEIKKAAADHFAEIVTVRRHLHANPELSFKEHKTAAFVWEQLENIGITNKKRMADTGIVALIEGKNPAKKTVALRADMDAFTRTQSPQLPESIGPDNRP